MGKSQIRCDSQISDISADCLSEFEIPFVFNFKADLKWNLKLYMYLNKPDGYVKFLIGNFTH